MKTEHIQKQLDFFVRDKAHHAYRKPAGDAHALAAELAAQGLDDMQRSVARLRYVLAQETPVVFPDERITLLRTVRTIPEIHTEEEDRQLHETHAFHENGRVFNMCPDYGMLMADGFTKKAEKVRAQLEQAETAEQKEFLQAMLDVLSIVTDFAARYREEALRVGNQTVADTLSKIPANAPETLLEALQFLRLLHYAMWCNGNYHNTIGRIDQFLYPYYRHDLDAGLLTKDGALELLEEFFVSCNRDSDLYIGIQQGDNGQTIVLGGSNEDGSDAYNDLSELCLIASRELCLIDPKVNLRVHKNTPLSVYELATTLTQKGLGFPQYTNDEIVIPALLRWGYEKQDAYNYTLAACWEILVTGYMDLVNWDSLNFLKTVQDACEHLPECKTYEEFAALVKQNIETQAGALMAETKNVYKEPSPLVSLMCPDCLEKMRDISKPGKYNNYGFHGDGLATAADSMAAVRKYVYDEKTFTPETMLAMLHADFKGYEREQNMLRYEGPKFGNDDDYVDEIAKRLFDSYAAGVRRQNEDRLPKTRYVDNVFSYNMHITLGESLGATANGRSAGEAISDCVGPTQGADTEGSTALLNSVLKLSHKDVTGAHALNFKISPSFVKDREGTQAAIRMLKVYLEQMGPQIQINYQNPKDLLDAQVHPDKHRDLVVRIAGYCEYFVNLDHRLQCEIIERTLHEVG